MEREWLAAELAAGRSIESIAREAGRSASTVAYWVNKHGLTSQHKSKYSPRGGIQRELLTQVRCSSTTSTRLRRLSRCRAEDSRGLSRRQGSK